MITVTNKEKGLTPKQKRFCEEYLIDTNATQAAIRAGYSEKTAKEQAARLLSKVNAKAYISELMEQKKSECVASADEVIQYLTSVMRGSSSSHVLARDEIGAERIVEKPPDEKEKLKAAELLAKRYGILSEKVSLDVKPIVISGSDSLED